MTSLAFSASIAPAIPVEAPGAGFKRPGSVLFVAEDRSIYKGLHPEAWGAWFRATDWWRAYTEFDLPTPSKIGRKLGVLSPAGPNGQLRLMVDAGERKLGSPLVTYDGQSILFSMAAAGDSFFRIYRVSADGGEPVQLTRAHAVRQDGRHFQAGKFHRRSGWG